MKPDPFLDFVLEQLEQVKGLGGVKSKAMFGGIY